MEESTVLHQSRSSLDESQDISVNSERCPCRRCNVIRIFILAFICIIILQLAAPSTFAIFKGVTSLELALVFVGISGAISIVKSIKYSRT